MSSSDFSFQSFSDILDGARKASNRHWYNCCIPGCNEQALKHSHIIPQCVLKKYICNSKHELVQCQVDEIHPMSAIGVGELSFEKFVTTGIEKAMSMPIFCAKHDNGLFAKYEINADAFSPKSTLFQVLQSLRAIGALRHREERMFVQNNEKAKNDSFYIGGIYEDEKKNYQYLLRRYDANIASLYYAVSNNDFGSFEFVCIELKRIGVAVCDAIVDEEDLEKYCLDDNYAEPINLLYVHLLPKEEHSYLIIGYDKRYVSEGQKILLKRWTKGLKSTIFLKTIYKILCHCSNNWCISPNCDEKVIEWLKNNYSIDRENTILGDSIDAD